MNEKLVSIEEIGAAMDRLRPVVHRTPLQRCRTLSEQCGRQVYLKLENLQKTGSFKLRGAVNKIYGLAPEEAARGVISASAGNHAQGVALAAQAMGVPAVVVMPQHAPETKVQATEGYGAKVVLAGNSYEEAYQEACRIQAASGMTFVHAFDDRDVIAGQGTITLEILERLYDVDLLVAPVGGGGLIAGMAAAAKQINPRLKVIGVQAENAPAMSISATCGVLQNVETSPTLADGICVSQPGEFTFAHVQRYVDEMVTVTESELTEAVLLLLERGKLITEGAGAAGVAAMLAQKLPLPGKNVAVVVSGGNIDPLLLSSMIHGRYRNAASF